MTAYQPEVADGLETRAEDDLTGSAAALDLIAGAITDRECQLTGMTRQDLAARIRRDLSGFRLRLPPACGTPSPGSSA